MAPWRRAGQSQAPLSCAAPRRHASRVASARTLGSILAAVCTPSARLAAGGSPHPTPPRLLALSVCPATRRPSVAAGCRAARPSGAVAFEASCFWNGSPGGVRRPAPRPGVPGEIQGSGLQAGLRAGELPRCCLTLRSTRPRAACRLGREAGKAIIGLAAQAPHRTGRVTSNVRQHSCDRSHSGSTPRRRRLALSNSATLRLP